MLRKATTMSILIFVPLVFIAMVDEIIREKVNERLNKMKSHRKRNARYFGSGRTLIF